MDIFKIVGIGLVTLIASLVVKSVKPDFALIVAMCGGLIIIGMTVNYCTDIITAFTAIVEKTGLNSGLFSAVLKIIGVGYLTEFSYSLCCDAGNSGLGDKIMLSGKIIILVMALPIITSIIDILSGLLP